MSEDLKKVEDKEEVVEKKEEKVKETKEEIPEYTDAEVEAMEQGWLPKDQWEEAGKDLNEWRTAREFNERGELFSTIHQLKRENKNLSSGLDSMKKHHQYVFDKAYTKAVADLKKERRVAMRDEDLDRVEQIEQEMESLQSEYSQQKQELQKVEVQPSQAPELHAFVQRNTWYETDSELRDEADAVGLVYANRHPGSSPSVILEHVEKTIKKRHPDKFGTRRSAPNAVTGVDRTRSTRKQEETYQLSELEEKIMNDLVRSGAMTKEQYIADLKKYDKERG